VKGDEVIKYPAVAIKVTLTVFVNPPNVITIVVELRNVQAELLSDTEQFEVTKVKSDGTVITS
jgi:hypothetical protein